MKRFNLHGMRSSLLKTQAWSIHEPTLAALMELMAEPLQLTAKQINERLGFSRPVSAESESTAQMVGNVAVLPIFGVIQQRASWMTKYLGWTATEQLERDFKAALANPEVKSIVLYCDSPGGVAVGIDEAAQAIFQGRQAKPVLAFIKGYAASACYYLASGASRMTATTSSTIGSIGTIYTHVEYSAFLEKAGIGVNIIKHGARKGDGNPYQKLSPEAKASLQKWVDAFGDQFDTAVARHRGTTVADVRAKYGQGEAFLAAEAKQRGMIDAVGTWDQVLASLKQSGPLPKVSQQSNIGHAAAIRLVPSTFSSQDGTLIAGWSPVLEAAYAAPLELSNLASGSPVAVSAGDSQPEPTAAAAATPEHSSMKVSAKVRAAMYARGLITAQDVDDGMCMVALGAYFAARGEACPQANEKLDDDKVIAALFAVTAPAGDKGGIAPNSQQPTAPAAGGAAPNVLQAHEREVNEARQQGAAGEQTRRSEIRASGKALNMTQEQIDAAIDSNKPFAEIAAGWARELGAKEKPISQGGENTSVKVGKDGIEIYMADALVATLIHYGQPAPEGAKITPHIEQLSHAPVWVHAEACLKAAGVRFDPYDREDIAAKALAMDGYEKSLVRADGGPFNRPGNFPNLLSALANKVFDEGVEAAEVTYTEYVGTWPGDLPDFKPAPVVARSGYGTLDEVLDAEEFKQQGLEEECLSYMVLGRFGNSSGLTPVMVANDDLGAFMDELSGLSEAWELTKNRGCLSLVTGNVVLLDTYALYDSTNHGNITGTGAAPSVTSWDAMQQKMAAQKTVGAKAYSRARLQVVLVPPKHEVAAQQTFLPLQGTVIVEDKKATADSGLNPFRGKVKVAMEPELADSSADKWYGFTNPKRFRNAAIIIAYFRGWGRGGRRERWYDPKTKCWYVSLEGRFGAAAKQYRTTVQNPGT